MSMLTPASRGRLVQRAKPALFLLCLAPLALLLWRFLGHHLGANPIEHITRSTGWWTLCFLMITLAVTPLRLDMTDEPFMTQLAQLLR